jgi:hypothetical protein
LKVMLDDSVKRVKGVADRYVGSYRKTVNCLA